MNATPVTTPGAGEAPAPIVNGPPALPLLSDRAYALRLDRIRLETAALMRHCLARVAYGEGRHADAACAECEAVSLEFAAMWLREEEGDGTGEGQAGPFAARSHLEARIDDQLNSARDNAARLPDFNAVADALQQVAAFRLALAVLAEAQAVPNVNQARPAIAA